MDTGTVGRIYKEDHYTLLLTKYESSGPCGFGEEDFFYVFPIVSLWELMTPGAGPFLMLHTKYESFGSCGFGEEGFLKFFP